MLFRYCYFLFKDKDGPRHELRVKAIDFSLEWGLYIDDVHKATVMDEHTNLLIEESLVRALSYENVKRVHEMLLSRV